VNILDILIDPGTNQRLKVNKETQEFLNLDPEMFFGRIEKGIPIILPKKKVLQSDKTQDHYSSFDYLTHYIKDSEVFNYALGHIDSVSKEEERRLHQNIISKIPKDAKIVLDIGCGSGWLSKSIQNDNNYVVSIDVSIENPYRALKEKPHKNHSALVADAFHLPIASESVDCIVASEIMEHVTDPKLFINNLLKPLKKGGKLIITTPYNEKIPKYLCVHCNNLTPRYGHLHSFNEENIKQIMPVKHQWSAFSFNNKHLNKLRINLLLKYLPFSIWKKIDLIVNKFTKKQLRFMIEIIK